MEVTIRSAEKSDVAGIKEIYAQPHAYSGTLQLPYPSEALWQSRFDNASADYHNLVAITNGKVIGQLGLMVSTRPRRKHVAGFGMAVCASVLGQGVATRLLESALHMCDNWLNIERVELEVFTDNKAAIALYRKFGFVIEGEHVSSAFKNGVYADVYSMARLRAAVVVKP
ncbi:GNAT family N-acetyltransferase [Corallincola spongiicola]|uniref:GNAT family N-acetyltransferase n=1 Tax=Corallincola spongiicola TaxID=2520508 RepID=A0ABY1WNG7_9GAMM|nr:GNAT family N-acetyltransferase [Corallincola spongiicola]TAA45089.1 GNAT family N-acetyltransferase [Corallincola spongiicola]